MTDTLRTGISGHCLAGFEPLEHLPLLAARGIRRVELSLGTADDYLDDARFAALRRVVAENGIEAQSFHVPYAMPGPEWRFLDISHPDPAVRGDAEQWASLCARRLAELGGRILVIHPSGEPIEDEERRSRLDTAADTLRRIRDALPAGAGIRIAVENLPRTNLCRDSAESIALIEGLNDPAFGICLDLNHINFREGPVAAATAYAPYTITTHVSDNDGENEMHWLPGRGVLPWQALIGALLAAGYRGPFIYETSQGQEQSTEEALAGILRNMHDLFVERKEPTP